MSPERLQLVVFGALEGLALWLLASHWPEAAGPALRLALVSFVLAFALVLHFAWTRADRMRLLGLALGVGALYGAVAFWVGWQLPRPGESFQGDASRQATWALCAGLSLFALGPFLQIHQRTRELRFPYAELFSNSWSNLFVAAIAALFLGALWTVLGLWGALFGLVKIDWFQDLFAQPVFAWGISGAAAALGTRLGQENARVIEMLRRITLLAHHVLLPLVSFVAVLFLGSLVFTGLSPLWEQDYASGLVLGWMALHVLFLNAAFQDGKEPPPTSRAVRMLASAGVLSLPGFGAIAVYGLGLRIEQHGLSPLRFWGALLAGIALCVGVSYAVSILQRRRGWLHTIPAVNRGLAGAAVALGLATHTPILDPLFWSAREQVRRLVDGRVPAGKFDFGFLRFELGRAGERALSELERTAWNEERAGVREGAARARMAADYEEWKSGFIGLRPEDIFVRGADGALPNELLEAIRSQTSSYQWLECRNSRECVAVAVELDSQHGSEWIVRLGNGEYFHTAVFSQVAGTWTRIGYLGGPGLDPDAALREGAIETVAPAWQDVLIGGERYRVERR